MTNSGASFQLPTVGVVITTYNYRNYVEDAIRSVLAQTYENWQCVIVDDASTDGSADSIRQFLETINDPRFRLIARTTNGGQLAGFRDGFAATDTAFVAFLDGDDMWLPDFLRAHVAAHLSSSHAAAVSSSDVLLIDKSGALITGTYPSLAKAGRPGSEDGQVVLPVYERLATLAPELRGVLAEPLTFFGPYTLGWIWSPTLSMVFRRGALEIVFSFPFTATKGQSDYLVAGCAHILGGSLLLSEPFGLYRRHGANLSSQEDYAGGQLWMSDSQWAYKRLVDKDIVDFAFANRDLLSKINGPKFLRHVLKHQFTGVSHMVAIYCDDPRVHQVMRGKDRWWWFRKRIQHRLRKALRGR